MKFITVAVVFFVAIIGVQSYPTTTSSLGPLLGLGLDKLGLFLNPLGVAPVGLGLNGLGLALGGSNGLGLNLAGLLHNLGLGRRSEYFNGIGDLGYSYGLGQGYGALSPQGPLLYSTPGFDTINEYGNLARGGISEHGATYVAKTPGAIHTAPLDGHTNSVSSVNVASAPGTL